MKKNIKIRNRDFSLRFLIILLIFAIFIQNISSAAQLIYKKNDTQGLVAITAFIKASSLNEKKSNSGISGFVAAMLREGTKKRNAFELEKELEDIGSTLNVEAAPDYTVISFISDSKNLEFGCEIISDILKNATFPEDKLKKRKKEAIKELELIKDNPTAYAHDELLPLIYQNHPYGYKSKIKLKNIKNFTQQDLLAFYKKNYKSKNIIISIVGEDNPHNIDNIVKKYFTLENSDGIKKKRTINIAKINKNITKKLKKKETKAAFLEIGYLTVPISDKDYPALKVLSNILGSGMSSRLFIEIREKQSLVYSVGSYFPTLKDKSYFATYAVCRPQNLNKVKTEINKQINKIKTKKITDSELKRAKNYINGKYIINHQSIIKQAWYRGWFELIGLGYKWDDNYKKMINKVTKDDILRVAQKYLKFPKTVILTPR